MWQSSVHIKREVNGRLRTFFGNAAGLPPRVPATPQAASSEADKGIHRSEKVNP
jgi:hypothetical protein